MQREGPHPCSPTLNITIKEPSEDNGHAPDARTSNLPPERKAAPREELIVVLDAEHADAVLDHRQRLRKPLTAFAAKLLAAKFARCADPNAAAETMISNGWQGFDPSWVRREAEWRREGPPAPQRGGGRPGAA